MQWYHTCMILPTIATGYDLPLLWLVPPDCCAHGSNIGFTTAAFHPSAAEATEAFHKALRRPATRRCTEQPSLQHAHIMESANERPSIISPHSSSASSSIQVGPAFRSRFECCVFCCGWAGARVCVRRWMHERGRRRRRVHGPCRQAALATSADASDDGRVEGAAEQQTK